MTRFASMLSAIVLIVVVAVACSDEKPPPPVCAAYEVPASTDLARPEVHFRADVVPLFVQSCAFTSCHGKELGGSAGLFLGLKDEAFEPARVHAAIVGVPANELKAMARVKAGEPHESFLMRKLDGDHCLLASSCENGDCGAGMPRTGALLPAAERDKVRRWIAQGAKDD